MSTLKETVLSGGIEEAAYLRIRDKIRDNNRRTVIMFSAIAIAAFFVLTVASMLAETLSPYRSVYVIGFVLSIIIWSIAKYKGADNVSVMTFDVYLFALMLMAVGIALGTFMSPNEIAATYIALLLAVPQVFTDRPWRMYLLIAVSIITFIVMALLFKDPTTLSSDITNAIIFGAVSVLLCTFSMKTRIARYHLEDQIRFLAENDQLTGLKNRYSYQQYLDNSTVLKSSSIYCIYVDVNGLHELNNSKGHEAGDRMLQYVASVMQHLFGAENTYRIGGDEFVALGVDKSLDEIKELVEAMKHAVESAGYHIAAGIGLQEKKEIEVNSIIKDAEKEMYKDKAEYYRLSGKDRRRQ